MAAPPVMPGFAPLIHVFFRKCRKPAGRALDRIEFAVFSPSWRAPRRLLSDGFGPK